LDILDFIKNYISKGISQVISTDISVDGTLNGPSIELYKDILTQTTGVYLIASGGVGSMDDIYKLDEISIPAVIVGKAIYEGKITSKQIESFNLQK
jgi:phosphoribosylformimino-5-aminoimidazole carboxamide ribotide isomerase